jgi:hypothetical protein
MVLYHPSGVVQDIRIDSLICLVGNS